MKEIALWRIGGIWFWFGLLAICQGAAQTTNAPPGNASAPAMAISIQALCAGEEVPDGASVPAPSAIYIFPQIETTLVLHAGETARIDFFVDGTLLCSDDAVWHAAIRPSNRPGQFSPMIMARAQFGYPSCEWRDPAVGNHVLTARAYGLRGLSAISAPLEITILPSKGK